MGHYIGEATITEAGLDLLAVHEQLNSEPENGFAENQSSHLGMSELSVLATPLSGRFDSWLLIIRIITRY